MADSSERPQLTMTVEELEHEFENIPILENCDMIRRKIRSLIDSGDMKVGEFRKTLRITPNTVPAAWAFFKKREMLGIKTIPAAKKVATATGKDVVPKVDDIKLAGEEDDAVEVYDTCDEIRRKINAFLKKPGVTAAAFCRAISASHHKTPKKISSTQLSAFRSKKGPYAGNTSAVFYGSYVYFEKLRIKEGKPKSKKRQEMEKIHGVRGGVVTDHLMETFICFGNERPSMDSFGRLTIHKK